MFETLASAHHLLSAPQWWVSGTTSLMVAHKLKSPEDACAAGMDAVKHASGAKDEDMPAGFCACPQIYEVRCEAADEAVYARCRPASCARALTSLSQTPVNAPNFPRTTSVIPSAAISCVIILRSDGEPPDEPECAGLQ